MKYRDREERAQMIACLAAILGTRQPPDEHVGSDRARDHVVEARFIAKAAFESEGLDFDDPEKGVDQ